MIFLDSKGNELKLGDKVLMTLIGLGSGEVEVVEYQNELCLYDTIQGYYPLKYACSRTDLILEII
jgi:hypothetical protein